MGHDVFKFGAISLDNEIQPIPKRPENNGDIPQYDGQTTISIVSTNQERSITWIKPNNDNLLVADRALLVNVSYEDLNKNGFIVGKPVLIDGQSFRCRLLQVGEKEGVPNEWDKILDVINKDDAFLHWKNMFFWGADISVQNSSYRAVRGYYSARNWLNGEAMARAAYVGFRPALEPSPSSSPTPNINLDGVYFQLTSLPGGNGFCPVLQPIQENVFKDIPVGDRIRMYTFIENGRPVHMDGQIEDVTKLTLTDRYFGDEYLVHWTISNGVAVANHAFLKKSQ